MACKKNLIFQNNAVAPREAAQGAHGHEPCKELIPDMLPGSRLLPSELQALESGGHLSGSHLFVFIAGGSEKWQNNVIRGWVHTCERRQGGPSGSRIYLPELPIRFVPVQTYTNMHHIYVTVLIQQERKKHAFLHWLFEHASMFQAKYLFAVNSSRTAGHFSILERCLAHFVPRELSLCYSLCQNFLPPNLLKMGSFWSLISPLIEVPDHPRINVTLFYFHYSTILTCLTIIIILHTCLYVCPSHPLLEYELYEIWGLILFPVISLE